MSLDQQEVAQLRRWIVEIVRSEMHDLNVASQIAINRGTVSRVDDATGVQELQCTALEGEVLDEVEHFQGYGFTANPPIGSEVCLLTVGDDRAHMIALGVNDRGERCASLEPGDACMYSLHGTSIHMRSFKGQAQIVCTVPTPLGQVLLGDDSAVDPVALQSKTHQLMEIMTASVAAWANAIPIGTPLTSLHAVTLAVNMILSANRPAAGGTAPLVGATKVLGV